ncbi:MAG: site-2 protease family protein [Methylacidiphilales bacterium]|nr:site-2 protease family protein [Candidatus Methylacidiphilales bacterium]
MTIYVTRNGQRYGPYSLAETQEHVRSGSLALSDLAWHDGLPNWIPLNQIQGFTYVRPPAPPVPVATTTPEATHQPRAENKSLLQKIGGGIVALAYAVFKFKFLLFGALKTSLSMLLMIWVYSWMFGWLFAAGLVFLILVHEMGHVIAAKWLGLPVSAPLFIPFLGASIIMKQNPRDAWTEALMAYGGPLAGCIGSWICWAVALYTQENWVMAVASVSFLINLFNMIPVPPLDGGRICAAVSPWFWIIGLLLLGASVVYFHAWNSIVIIILVLILALPRMKQTLFGQTTEQMRAYYNTHIVNRLSMALMYLGLIAALLLGYWDANNYLMGLINNS